MDRSKNEKTVDARTVHTDSLKSTARSSKRKGADMLGIQKIKNEDGTYSYRAQVRLNNGIPQQSKSFPSLVGNIETNLGETPSHLKSTS